MDLLATNITDHEINKQYWAGSFPDDLVFSSVIAEDRCLFTDSRIHELCRDLISAFMENQGSLSIILKEIKKAKDSYNGTMSSLGITSYSSSEINSLVNTLTALNTTISNSELEKRAAALYPVVTEIDAVLYLSLIGLAMIIRVFSSKKIKEKDMVEELLLFGVYLFNTVQKKEYLSNCTININNISENTPILDLIDSVWSENNNDAFEIISNQEYKKIKVIYEERVQLVSKSLIEWGNGAVYAVKTEKDWQLFLDLLNRLSIKEHETIEVLLSSDISREKKIEAINKYDDYIRKENCGFGSNDDEFVAFAATIFNRFCDASPFCMVHTETDISPFDLCFASIVLFRRPYTFNYLLMLFHRFRIEKTTENAKPFFSVAYECLLKNIHVSELVFPEDDEMTIEDILDSSLREIESFWNEYKDSISTLSFHSIQKDSASPLGLLDPLIYLDMFTGPISEWFIPVIDCINAINENDQEALNVVTSNLKTMEAARENVYDKIRELSSWKQQRYGKQLIVSINIIYLMCDAIEIIMSSDELKNSLISPRSVQKIYRKLNSICVNLDSLVYSDLNEEEVDMLEYRSIHGINYTALNAQEEKTAEYEYAQVLESFKDYIIRITDNLDRQSVEQIIAINTDVREKISRVPKSNKTDELLALLDNSNQIIRDALIEKSAHSDSFSKCKESILLFIGSKCSMVSDIIINTLTTAELLFNTYANDKYAASGFDYSCISSLFYQALEETYNLLIWSDYADYLNSLSVGGKPYTELLFEKQSINFTVGDEKGYLPSSANSRRHYVKYDRNKKSGIVNKQCMYGSFSIMIEGILPEQSLFRFAEFFARKVGFKNRNEMFAQADYLCNLRQFSEDIKKSVDFRNNASHGGEIVELEQCQTDKRIVLSSIANIRDESMGLINRLLSLFL